MAVSAPKSERTSMAGGRGEAQAEECPGAMIPALLAVASRPTPSSASTTVTSWPSVASQYAVVIPTMPPPSTSVFTLTSFSRLKRVGPLFLDPDRHPLCQSNGAHPHEQAQY